MKIDPIRGRLGHHRFHPMLVHFPVALYPFSLIMYWLSRNDPALAVAGCYAHAAAVATSLLAVIYGFMDFLKIDPESRAWRTAVVHAILNACWFFTFVILLLYEIRHPGSGRTTAFLIVMSAAVAGLFVSNYFGAELIIRYRIGIPEKDTQSPP